MSASVQTPTVENSLHSMAQRLRAAPWTFGFFPLLRRLAAARPRQPVVGKASRPQQETFRLGQAAALTFAPREIADVTLPGEGFGSTSGGVTSAARRHSAHLLVRLYGLGLLGPNGPLPLHYTEIVRERAENYGDTTLGDFLDIFHHRYLTHLYRAWAQGQATAGLDRPEDESFSRYVARLTGHEPSEIGDSVLPLHARLAATSHLSRESRNPDGLASTLSRFFAVPVKIEEFVLHWIRLAQEDESRLGVPRDSSFMGVGALAGEMVADRQNKFRIVLGPLNLQQYLRFTPRGEDLRVLVEWVRGFIGYEFLWEVELRLRNDNTPRARLDDGERLGWSTWLGGAGDEDSDAKRHMHESDGLGYSIGMVFEPELYVRSDRSE